MNRVSVVATMVAATAIKAVERGGLRPALSFSTVRVQFICPHKFINEPA